MIRAQVGEIELGELLRTLEVNSKSAVVSVTTPRVRGRIHLHGGRIIYIHNVPGPHLGEYMVRMHYMSLEQIQELVARQDIENPGTPLGQLALQIGYIDKNELRLVLEAQVLEALAILLNQKEGEIVAETIPSDSSQVVLPDTFETGAFVMEATRRLDEWQRGRVKPEEVLRMATDPTKHSLSSNAWNLLELVDGLKRARSVALESELPEVEVYHLLHELKERGILEEADVRPDDPLVMVLAESSLLQRLLLYALERARYRVQLPHDIEVAKRTLQKERPHAILIQSDSPHDWVRQIRTSPGGRYTPIWVVSESSPRGFWVRVQRVQHIPLPFNEPELLEALSNVKRPV